MNLTVLYLDASVGTRTPIYLFSSLLRRERLLWYLVPFFDWLRIAAEPSAEHLRRRLPYHLVVL